MSLLLTLYVPEGIIIAGDSRLTLNWSSQLGADVTSHTITASDSNNKVFILKDKFGLGIFGAADVNGIPISGFINQFIEEKINDNTEIDQIPMLLHDFFGERFNMPKINFYIVGYKTENGISVQHVYHLDIHNAITTRVNISNNRIEYGANWGGEVEVLLRIIQNIKIFRNGNWIDLPAIPIPWNFFTLQDAIDFALYAIRTTIETMRFQQKEKTVGGPIDILAIKPNEKPIWIKKKIYKAE